MAAVLGGAGWLLVWSWIVLQITPLLIIKFALTILWLIGFEWVFALQARFENTVAGTLKNAFIFGISHIAMTVALVLVDAVFVALLVASWFYMPGGLFLLVILGYGTMLMLHIPLPSVFSIHILIDQAGSLANMRRSSRSERSLSTSAVKITN